MLLLERPLEKKETALNIALHLEVGQQDSGGDAT